ncbi:hypothetical protein CORC01_02263, partial [Colletotrichum orchidophilum]
PRKLPAADTAILKNSPRGKGDARDPQDCYKESSHPCRRPDSSDQDLPFHVSPLAHIERPRAGVIRSPAASSGWATPSERGGDWSAVGEEDGGRAESREGTFRDESEASTSGHERVKGDSSAFYFWPTLVSSLVTREQVWLLISTTSGLATGPPSSGGVG